MLFDLQGKQIGCAQREFKQYFPQPGWVEHDPNEIWESQLATARDVLAQSQMKPEEIVAIGITNQRETTVLWDRRSGEPVHRAIVWQDRRSADICDELKAQSLEKTFGEKTGLVLDPYFSGTKIAWLLRNVGGLAARADRGELAFGTIDTWLMHKLTAGRVHLTDVTNAARTLLFNIHTLSWDDELLSALEIPKSILPEVRPSASRFAQTDAALFGASIPIAAVAGDQQAALFGQACFSPGMAKNTYGTGAFTVMNTGTKSVSGPGVILTLAWQIEGRPAEYALEGSIFIAGAAVQWLRDGLGIIEAAADVESLAASVPDNGGVYFVPALAGLGSPHWDSCARGTIVGLTRGTTKAHLARATLEAIAYQTKDAVAAMEITSDLKLTELRVDGGAAVNDLLLQFQSDILDVPVLRPKITETTALGAALLAGIGASVIDQPAIEKLWALDRRFEPRMDPGQRDRFYREWRRAVDRALNWIED